MSERCKDIALRMTNQSRRVSKGAFCKSVLKRGSRGERSLCRRTHTHLSEDFRPAEGAFRHSEEVFTLRQQRRRRQINIPRGD